MAAMKVGAEPKKLAVLVGLLLVAVYLFYSNSRPSVPSQQAAQQKAARSQRAGAAATTATPTPVRPSTGTAGATNPAASNLTSLQQQAGIAGAEAGRPATSAARTSRMQNSNRRVLQEFKPSLKAVAEQMADATTVDPTLRTDLLANVQAVRIEGSMRNLFQFGAAPPPEKLEAKIIPKKPDTAAAALTPSQPEEVKPAAPPPPPPIPLQFYGFSSLRQGAKRAFFLDGEEILVAGEGEVIKGRYRVVRIGVNSVVMEDIPNKSQQTLRIVQEVG
jgi:hypothetical protein